MRSAFALSSASDRVPSSWLTRACRSPTRSPMRSPPTNRMSFSSRNWLRCVSLDCRACRASFTWVVRNRVAYWLASFLSSSCWAMTESASVFTTWAASSGLRLSNETLTSRVFRTGSTRSRSRNASVSSPGRRPTEANSGWRSRSTSPMTRLASARRCRRRWYVCSWVCAKSPAFSSRPVGSNFRIRGSSFSMRSIAVPVNTGRAVTLQTNAVRTAPRNTSATVPRRRVSTVQ